MTGRNIPNCNQPLNPRNGGYYEMALKSGAMTVIAAGADVFALRFVSNPANGIKKRFELKYLKVDFIATTGFTGAQVVEFDAFIARAFSASDTGGTASLPPAGMQKKQTLYPDSDVLTYGDLRISNTSALGNGTRTPDTFPFACFPGYASAGAAGLTRLLPLMQEFGEHHVPVVLRSNEGIIIQPGVTMGAAGVGNLFVDIGWMELVDDGMANTW